MALQLQTMAMPANLLRFSANSLLPGSSLVLAGRLLTGLALLLPALACLALILLGLALTGGELWDRILLGGLIAYLSLALLADLLLWLALRQPQVDGAQAQQLYERSAAAWLGERQSEAQEAARELCKRCPHLPGAWKLLAICADSSGNDKQAIKARRRARRLLEQEEL